MYEFGRFLFWSLGSLVGLCVLVSRAALGFIMLEFVTERLILHRVLDQDPSGLLIQSKLLNNQVSHIVGIRHTVLKIHSP